MPYRFVIIAIACAGRGDDSATTPTTPTDTGQSPTTGTTDTGTTIDVPQGGVSICAGTEFALTERAFDVSGTVTDLGAIGADGGPVETAGDLVGSFLCPDDTRFISIEDAGGAAWHVGYAVTDHLGAQLAPDLSVANGDSIQLEFGESESGYSFGTALVVRADTGALVGAFVESADDLAPLDAAAFAGLTVSEGAVITTQGGSCGETEHRSLDFSGDETVEVPIGESATLALNGANLTARNADAWRLLTNDHCTDNASSRVA